MKLAYNPSDRPALTGVSSDNKDIIFDLSGIAIYARGVKFDGKTPTVFKKHTSANTGGYDGLVPAPSYADSATRFLREDGTWVTPDVFNPSQYTTDDILSLTNYTKATELQDLTTSDTLNVALGKLEYKSDLGVTAYNWYKSVTDEDTDEHINKWNEIVDFLNGVTDTTLNSILNNFINDLEVTGTGNAVTDVSKSNNKITVTKGNSFLPLSGGTISSSTYGALVVNRNTTSGHSGIKFSNNTEMLGILGVGGAGNSTYAYQPMFQDKDAKSYILIHSGNIGSQSVDNADKLDGYHAKASNTPFDGIPVIRGDGVMEIGKYIDFHNDNTSNNDYDCRLDIQGGNGNIVHLPSTSGILALLTDNVASAAKLQTARKIWENSFDGTGDVSGFPCFPYEIGINRSPNSGAMLNANYVGLGIQTYGSYVGFKVYGTDGVNKGTILSITSSGHIEIANQLWVKSYLNINRNGSTGAMYDTSRMGVEIEPYADYFTIRGYKSGSSAHASINITSSGNIGIGTTSPQYKLDVNGSLRVNGYAMGLGGAIDFQFTDEINRYGGNLYLQHRGDGSQSGTGGSATGNIVMCKNGGNVLIGTSTDSGYKLDVNGTARASGFIKSGSSSAYVLTGDGGHKLISDFATASAYVKKAGDTMTGGLVQEIKNKWLNQARLQIGRLDSAVYSDRAIIGVTDGNLHLDAYKNKAIYLNYYQTPGTTEGLESTALVMIPSGNVGIGTASPSEKLSVNGSIYTIQPSSNRRAGIIGSYDPNRAAAIWSMGSSYQIAADGTTFGSLYGAAYAYFGSGYRFGAGYSGGHSFVWCQNGTPYVALGYGIWTSGSIEAGGYLTFGGYGARFTSDVRSSWRTSIYGDTVNSSRLRTVRTDVTIADFSEIYGSGLTWATGDTQGYLSVSYGSGKAWIGGGNGNSLNWSTYLVTGNNIGSQSVNYANTAGNANYASSAGSSGSCSGNANGLASTGYGNGNLTYYQTDGSFFGNSGWSHYIIANHGNGSNYYNYTIALPFWDVPKYKRLEGGTADGWHTFITSENISSQSVNYASSAGNANTVDGYHIAVQSSAGTDASTIYFVI